MVDRSWDRYPVIIDHHREPFIFLVNRARHPPPADALVIKVRVSRIGMVPRILRRLDKSVEKPEPPQLCVSGLNSFCIDGHDHFSNETKQSISLLIAHEVASRKRRDANCALPHGGIPDLDLKKLEEAYICKQFSDLWTPPMAINDC